MPNSFARADLDPNVKAVLLYLASHTSTHVIYDKTAAKALGIGRNRFAKWVQVAARTDHLVRVATGNQDRQGNAEYVLHVSLVGFNADQKLAILAGVGPGPCTKTVHGRAPKQSTREEQSLEDQSLSRSFLTEPTALPDDWQPNHTHQVVAAELGLDLQELVNEFHSTNAAYFEQRTDWDKTFGAFMRDFAGQNYWVPA